MPGLTAAQIASGTKRNVRTIPPPPDKPGRWRCALCPWPRWVPGTYQDSLDHYRTTHQGKD